LKKYIQLTHPIVTIKFKKGSYKMNTYGLGDSLIEGNAFPLLQNATQADKETRIDFIKSLRVSHTALNILGYFPAINFFSGIVRIIGGSAIFVKSFSVRTFSQEGKKELRLTAIAQIARGALEIFVPNAWMFNLLADFSVNSYRTLKIA
jgi:hypothetical protein